MDDYLAHPTRLEEIIATDGGLDLVAARTVIAGIDLYTADDADVFMNESVFPLDQPQVEQSIAAIGAVLALIHPDIDLTRARVDGRYVRQLVS